MSEKMDLNKIQKIMDKRGWSLDAIGEKLGITQEELASVEEAKIEDPTPTETTSEKVEETKETEKVPGVKVEENTKVEETKPEEETRVTKVQPQETSIYDKQIADLLKENATLKEKMASQTEKVDKIYEMLKAQGKPVEENRESYATKLGASPYPNFSKSSGSKIESYGDLLGK